MRYIFLALLVVLEGKMMNMAVILANGGMPVVGLDYADGKWIPVTEGTKFVFYVDRMNWWGFNIGDFIMIFGGILVTIFAVRWMNAKTD